jgi:hypothetical protein
VIALAAILSRHRVELVPHARIDHRAAITLSPYPAVPIILREKAAQPLASPLVGSIHELVICRPPVERGQNAHRAPFGGQGKTGAASAAPASLDG